MEGKIIKEPGTDAINIDNKNNSEITSSISLKELKHFKIMKEMLNNDLDKLLSVLSLDNEDHINDKEIEMCKDLIKKSK